MRSSKRRRTGTSPGRLTALVLVPAVVFLIAGCSSSPDGPEPDVTRKNQAARYAEFGNAQYNRGDYNLALRYFDLALAENTAVDNLPGIAQSHNSIGRVYLATGNPAEARESFLTAIEFADLADSREHRMQAHVNLGVVALQQGDAAAAEAYFDRAQSAIDAGHAEPNAILYHSQGLLLAREERFSDAVARINRARELNRKNGTFAELAGNYYMLASIASRQGRFSDALSHAEQALEYDKQAENSPGIAADLHALGTIHSRMGNRDEAYQYYLRSLRVYLVLNRPRKAAELLGYLEEISEETGRDSEAAEFRSQRIRIEEALGSSSTGGTRE